MTDLSTLKWFLVCTINSNNEIKVIARENLKTDAIKYMKDNDNGSYFILEALA